MPQMAPLNWLSLFFMFLMIFMAFNSLNYFNFAYKPINKNMNLPQKKLHWKW